MNNEHDYDFEDDEEVILNEEDWESVHEINDSDKSNYMLSDDDNYQEIESEQHSVNLDDYKDDAFFTFDKHTDAVYCCSLSRSGKLALSGGGDDKAYLWKTDNGTVILTILQQDSVVGAYFNHNDSLFAIVDMKGFLQIYNASLNEKIFEYNVGEDVNWMKWHPFFDNIVYLGSSSGITWVISTNQTLKQLHGLGFPNSAGAIFPDGKRVLAGYENGVIRIFDIQKYSPIHTIKTPHSHLKAIVTVDIMHDNSLVVTGSLDSTAKLINPLSGKVICNFECGEQQKDDSVTDSVESLSFSKHFPFLATGSLNGWFEIWDINTKVKRTKTKVPEGISKIIWPQESPFYVYVAGLDGKLRIFDYRNESLKETKSGHKHQILDFSLSENNNFILTSSQDKTCKLFTNF